MKYGYLFKDLALEFAQDQTVLWACAYGAMDRNGYLRLDQPPVQGILAFAHNNLCLAAYGDRTFHYRDPYTHYLFADTCEEAWELYNQQVLEQYRRLEQWKQEAAAAYRGQYPLSNEGWTPVSSGQYPDDEVDVQVTYLGYYDQKPRCNLCAYRRKGIWYHTSGDAEVSVDITAWRPLNEPYGPGKETDHEIS